MPPYRYILAFGSNLGDTTENCTKAINLLKAQGVQFLSTSRCMLTKPLQHPLLSTSDQLDYCNFVADVAAAYGPEMLYRLIVEIEDKLGHSRTQRWTSRHMDIDILFWAENTDPTFANCSFLSLAPGMTDLEIPHRDFFNRDFLTDLVTNDLQIPLTVLKNFTQKKSNPSRITP